MKTNYCTCALKVHKQSGHDMFEWAWSGSGYGQHYPQQLKKIKGITMVSQTEIYNVQKHAKYNVLTICK